MRRSLPLVAVLLVFLGCSGERKPAGSQIPAGGTSSTLPQGAASLGRGGSLRIEPAEVYRGTLIHLSATGFPLDAATIEWLVNGKAAGSLPVTGVLKKGDTIQAHATRGGGSALSQVVTVRNSSPEIRGVRFVGGDGRPGNALGIEMEGYDADGDVVRFEITWQRNGQPAGSGSRLTTPVKRGDKVTVEITPFDGEDRGKYVTFSREILNTPPVIEGQEQFQLKENIASFHVRASDADGDSLMYSLKDAHAGMSIDRSTGIVRWQTTPGTTGKVPFTVTVADGSGGEATARFLVSISEELAPGVGTR